MTSGVVVVVVMVMVMERWADGGEDVGVLFTLCLPRRVLASHQRAVPCDASVS